MTYKVDLLNYETLTTIKEIEVVNEPTIHEEINGSFTLDFEAHYTAKNDLTRNVIVAVDGKYFRIAKVVKSRNDSISLSVHCEHISYDLIVDYEVDTDMEFESDVRTMIERFLYGTRFTLVDCIQTEVKYYTTKTLDIRKRLFEVANLFAGELVFDNYNVSLVHQRGSNKGLEIELGVNLIGVTEEQDFVENITSYELDLLDLSNVAGYENMDFSNVEIGDTITIIDSVLGINTTERILAIDYNPFKKALPTVTVGDYIRDLTEYLKPEPEEDEDDEEEKGVKSFFKQFKIGGVDMLQLSSDVGSDVKEYLTNKYLLGVEVSETYNTLKKELTGIVAEKADNVGGVLSVVQTKTNENGLILTTITEITSPTQLSSVVIKDVEHITLVISDRSISYYKQNPEYAETAEVKAIGICITFNDGDGVFLEKFNVGKLSMLGAENLDVTDLILDFMLGGINPNEAEVGAINELDEQLKGLEVVPTEDYMDWFLTLIHAYNHGDDEYDWNMETHDLPIENYAEFKVTSHTKDFLFVVISNAPFQDILAEVATEDVYFKAFGGTFMMGEPPEEIGGASDYFDEFRIGDVDMIPLASNEAEAALGLFESESTIVAGAIHYEAEPSSLIGVFVTPKPEYADKHLILFDYYKELNGATHFYTDSYEYNVINRDIHNVSLPFEELSTSSFTIALFEYDPREMVDRGDSPEDVFICAFGIQVKLEGAEDEEPSDEDQLYFEFGSCENANFMELNFENGPYTFVYSITTGINIPYYPSAPMSLRSLPASINDVETTNNGESVNEPGLINEPEVSTFNITPRDNDLRDMTVFTELTYDGNDLIKGIRAYSTQPYFNADIHFHAVCSKKPRPMNE